MKNNNNALNFNEKLTPCHAVMIVDQGFSSRFDTCEAVIKDHKVYAYTNNKGKIELLPVRDTEFFRSNDWFDEYSDPQLLLHFELNGKWGLFSIKTGAIVIKPVWDFIGRVTTNYLHVISTIDKLELEVQNDAVESEQFDHVVEIERAIAEIPQAFPETDMAISDDWELQKEFKSMRELDGDPLLARKTVSPLFNKNGDLNFTDYYEYLEHLDYGGCKHGMINRSNQVVIPVEYDYLREILIDRESCFLVQKGQLMGLLSAENKFIIPLVWNDMGIVPDLYAKDEKLIIVSRDQQFGVIDLESRIIIPLIYDKIEMARIGETVYFKVLANGKEGIVNRNNEPMIPIRWDRLTPHSFWNDTFDCDTLWEGALEAIICFEKAPEFESLAEAMADDGSDTFKFGIYDLQFNLVCSAELDGYQIVDERYEFADCIKIHSYVLIGKGEQYGVLIDGVNLISPPVISYEAALDLFRQQQRATYINDFIDDLKEQVHQIRMSYELPDREGKQIVYKPVYWEWEGGTMSDWVDETMGLRRTMPSKDRLVSVAEYVVMVLEDLKEQELADSAKGLMALIEAEQYQDLVTMLDKMVNRLAALKS